VTLDEALPAQKFVNRELVAFASVVEAQKPATDCCNDLRLAADNPTFCRWRGKVRYG
jgi:hypothetical protein